MNRPTFGFFLLLQGLVNVPIEHDPTIGDISSPTMGRWCEANRSKSPKKDIYPCIIVFSIDHHFLRFSSFFNDDCIHCLLFWWLSFFFDISIDYPWPKMMIINWTMMINNDDYPLSMASFHHPMLQIKSQPSERRSSPSRAPLGPRRPGDHPSTWATSNWWLPFSHQLKLWLYVYIYILHSIYYIILYQIISNLISYYFTFYLHNIYIYTHTNCWFVSFMVCLNMETFSPITPLKWQHDHGLEWATLGCPIGTWTQPKRNASITWF